jgi:riboflavin kinase
LGRFLSLTQARERVGLGALKGNLLLTLCRLAEFSAPTAEFACTTSELAVKLGYSQQTASRHLIDLERRGLIRRVRTAKRESIRITSNGLSLIGEMYVTLKRVFEKPAGEIYLEGELFSGLGEGSYYIGQEGYRRQLREKLGLDPYPGTLNVRLKSGYEGEKRRLETLPLVHIEGFSAEKRSFGPAWVTRAVVNDDVEAAVILALRSHYGPDVIELVAEENLRKRLRLKDGDTVKVRVITSAPR